MFVSISVLDILMHMHARVYLLVFVSTFVCVPVCMHYVDAGTYTPFMLVNLKNKFSG